ncbi:RHS repeat-associated core domain-containing protein [Streptomyces sp. IB2014 016-6]|uniref:RHS repeat-associated core domain-containing protein n=1 Tax=Streptomyces sp. IB2014 016-6 TaxID=2517818 RepID=UPI00164EE7D4|nr:RHS repeat-associated core domain-containing protein [Streptomyces sp. IB2014 016-6]
MSVRRRSLTVGLLALALSAGLVSAEAAPPAPAPGASSPSSELSSAQPKPSNGPAGPVAPASAAAAEPTTKDAVYAYDAASRLVGVTDPAGETARYRYDAAGNRLGVDRYESSTLSVLSLVPVRAQAGAKVTLSGTGFSPTPASNTVKFGTATATVTSATATRLVVTVPAGAADGKVSVTTGGTTVQSPESFTLATPAPSITKVEPASGVVGSRVVLSGTNFAPSASDNVVRFTGGVIAEIEPGNTSTGLTVVVPLGAANGPLEIATPDGEAASATSYRVVYGDGGGEIETSEETTVGDETPPTVSVTTPGNQAQVLFNAFAGDDINIGITGSTFNTSVNARLVDPQGKRVDSFAFSREQADGEFTDVPVSGQYSLLLDPGANNIGAATVVVSHPKTAALAISGAPVTAQLTRPGQDQLLTFTGVLGTSLSLGIDAAQMPGGLAVRLYGPNGDQVESIAVSGGKSGAIDVDALPQSGTYTLALDPNAGGGGTLTVTASPYADAGTLALTGPPVVLSLTRPGQDGIARFSAQAGQRVSLGATTTGFGAYVRVDIRRPDGSEVGSFSAPADGTEDWDSEPLPDTGVYTVAVHPSHDLATGEIALSLSQPVSVAQLSVAGSAVAMDIGRTGQDAETVFQGQQGDTLSLGATGSTFTEYVDVTVVAPSGAKVVDGVNVTAGESTTIGLPPLTETGTYRLYADPNNGAVGTLSMILSADIATSLTPDGPQQATTTTRAGQRVRAQFTAPDSASLGIGITANTMPEITEITLTGPAGPTGTVVGRMARTAPDAYYLNDLTPGTSYTLLFEPEEAAKGGMTLWLSKPVQAGTLTAGSAPRVGEITRAGQQLEYKTDAAAGAGAAVVFDTTTFAKTSTIFHRTPNGTEENLGSLTRTTSADADLRAPLTAGTHRVLVRPSEPVTGTTSATLIPDADGGTLATTGTRKPVTIATAGQNGRYTFTGTQGQKLTLGLNTPPAAWALSVYGPDGKWLVDARSMSATAVTYALPTLPATGTYTLTVDPNTLKTGTYTLGLTAAAAITGTDSPRRSADKPKTGSDDTAPPAARITPSGPDAWQPDKENLAGYDWLTRRGDAPKSPAALRAPPKTTALTGRVLKLDGKPLAKVTVSVGKKSAKTDARGRFLLSGIADTSTTLVVEGASANSSKRSYGRYDIRISPKGGRTVDLGFPVWMTPLDTKNTVKFAAPAKADVVLKTPKIPGLEVRIPKGSVVRDEKGKPVTELGITAIPIDRPPFPLPENGIVPVYFTVQPGGAYVFPEGAQIIYPNYTREAPGTRVKFQDYDPKKKGWYVYGKGEVSADGRQVIPDKKTRVWAFHGAMFNIDDLIPWEDTWIEDVIDWLSGDPVELSTGLLTDSRTDLAVAGSTTSADVTRTYWQGDKEKRAFGIGRDLSYNAFLHSKKQWQEVDLYLPGGSKTHFTRTSSGTGWTDAVFEPVDTSSDFQGSKITWKGYNSGWDLTFRDGTVWVFPQYAALKEIRDRHGNSIKLTRRDGKNGEITRITTSGGRWISLAYDTQHRVDTAKDNTGRTTSYTYDSAGRLETVKDPAGKISRYTYDGTSNRIKTATDARGITYMKNEFYADGRVKEQTLTEGAKYSFAYTQTGAGKITSANVTQPAGSVRRVEFDTDGYGVKDTEAYGSSLARETQYHRGPKHRIEAVTDPYNRRTDLTYDANGYVTRTTELAGTLQARQSGTAVYNGPYDQPTSVSDPLGNTTTLDYDESGDLRTVTDPEDRETTLTYTSDGQIKTVSDASAAVTEYTYRHGELVSVKDAEGRIGAQFLDAAGRPTVLTDEAGSITSVTYDALNQTRKITDPLGQSTSLDFDENGNLKKLTDARLNSTTWAYDDADRTESVTDPLGAQALFDYDAAGRLAKATSRSGLAATAEYDLLGRSKNTKYGVNAAGVAESTATYMYDAVDLPKTVTDTQAGDQSFGYDVYDRLKTVAGPTGTVGYDYDAADRRKEMTTAGTTTVYGYDTSSILTSVTSGGQEVRFGLDAVGREKTATLPGGITRTTTLDKTGTVNVIDYTKGTSAVGDLTYTRDTRGLQTGLTGSLASVALPAAETGAVFGKDNRVTSLGGRSFTYDADGQLKSDGKRTYNWNARGQLSGVTPTGGGSAGLFGYDPLGVRSSKKLGDATQKYLTDGSNPLVEQDGSGAAKATVATSGLDQYLTRTENGKTQVYLTDALGTVVGLANADGTVATSYTYDPYGQPTASGAASTNPYTFTGRESDGTGLLHYRNRYYDPESGRFISQDPIGYAGGTNLYQYALSSPTTYTDPTGNSPMLAGCVIGGLGEAGLDWLGQRLSGRKVNWGQVGTSAALGCVGGMIGKIKWLSRGDSCLTDAVGKNSFTADTPVLLADGTRKPIKDIQIGDQVLAADPETGEWGPRSVTALIKGAGDKQLVDITLADGKTSTVTATDGHPFWVPALGRWVEADDLTTGQWLQTSSGTWVQITAVTHHTKSTTVYNLTVDDLNTYYVVAGTTPVLVHNVNVTCPTPRFEVNSNGVATDLQADMSRANKVFTPKGKRDVIQANRDVNGGKTVCDDCLTPTIPAKQSTTGGGVNRLETRVDHIWPQSLGGPGSPWNGRVTCYTCNERWSNTPKGPLK